MSIRQIRYALAKKGYGLHKSRAKNTNYYNEGGYMIYDYITNGVVCGNRYELSLDDIIDFIEE